MPNELASRRAVIETALAILADLSHPMSDLLNGARETAGETSLGEALDQASAIPVTGAQEVAARRVDFPPGSPGAQHAFFPLTGKHARIECAACHTTDQYAGTPTDCTTCHAAKTPANHYPGECSQCHTTEAWKPAHFDHASAAAANCQTCHTPDKPANHWEGQCSLCHTTKAWKPATFQPRGHAGQSTAFPAIPTKNRPTTGTGSARCVTTPMPGNQPASITLLPGCQLHFLPHQK